MLKKYSNKLRPSVGPVLNGLSRRLRPSVVWNVIISEFWCKEEIPLLIVRFLYSMDLIVRICSLLWFPHKNLLSSNSSHPIGMSIVGNSDVQWCDWPYLGRERLLLNRFNVRNGWNVGNFTQYIPLQMNMQWHAYSCICWQRQRLLKIWSIIASLSNSLACWFLCCFDAIYKSI